MNLQEFVNRLLKENNKTIKLRNYTEVELAEEIEKIKNTPSNIYPYNIKEKIINKMQYTKGYSIDKIITYLNFNTIKNIEQEIGLSLDKARMKHLEDPMYNKKFQSIDQEYLPPPFVVEYNENKRLIAGNIEYARLFIEFYVSKVPVILIKVEG